MDVVDQLIADWIQIRTTLKSQLKHFDAGDGPSAAEAKERVHRCVAEIELLISHYSSRG